jgi:aminoglycoside 3-N-acetyltransferase I
MSGGQVRIVRLGPGDEARVLAAADLFDGPPRPAWTRTFLAKPGHHMLVAYAAGSDSPTHGDGPSHGDGGEAVGFVTGVEIAHPDKGTEMLVYELGTAEAHRRRGIATALLAALEVVATDAGHYDLWVPTEPDNTAALATYAAAGYAPPETVVVLIKDLGDQAARPDRSG